MSLPDALLLALADEIEKIANQPNPMLRMATGGALAGGVIGAYHGFTRPLQQDQQGNYYQPTVADRFAAGAKGLYRGGLVGGLVGLGAGAVSRSQ